MQSMTGFYALPGGIGPSQWHWELRSVNARGLDLRMRLPEGFEALEPAVRKAAKSLHRGAVSVSLKLALPGAAGEGAAAALDGLLADLQKITARAAGVGAVLEPDTATAIHARLAALGSGTLVRPDAPTLKAMTGEVAAAFAGLQKARAAEGKALHTVLTGQVAQIEALVSAGADRAKARAAEAGPMLRARIASLLDATDIVTEDRLAQELALLAVKADVTEEIDRLVAHVAAARALLGQDGAVGRALDFLMQEFNREANTLCSKSNDPALTAIGLELKLVIDQMREQVQNVE